MKKLTYS